MDVKVFFMKTGQEFCGVIADDQPDDGEYVNITHLTVPTINQANQVSLLPMSLTTPDITMPFRDEEMRLIVSAPAGLVAQYEQLFNPNAVKIATPTDAEVMQSKITRV